ncbi:MAG TPA: CocE/NonD family hydrolase [Jatrophihabitans sp.]|nr:CocE/NonD family hydrolase [Jatrophihabitans sp.]
MRAAIVPGLLVAGCLAVGGPGAEPAGSAPGSTPTPSSTLSPELPRSVIDASSAPGSTWTPEHARFGTVSRNDVPVRMADGKILRVNVIYPKDPGTGKPAAGRFPVLLTQTPYGKGQGSNSAAGSAERPGGSSPTGGSDDYLVERGYIEVVADVRGTGDSQGSWGLFDPIQTRDAIGLVHWAARLPHSSGKVGTYGPSYLGINQMLLAGRIGRHSPLKAIFPMVAATDIYRDTSFMGGILDSEFDLAYLGLTGGLNLINPLVDAMQNPPTDAATLQYLASVEADHANGLASYHAKQTQNILTGGAQAYDGAYWRARQPGRLLSRIVANGIPAYLIGGEFDIFQRGEPLNYAGLQNAWAGRSTTAPMRVGQRVTGRYQLIDGPWEHLNGSSVDVDRLELEWFDTWLKGERTGMAHTPTPLHYYDLGRHRYAETTTFPFTGATPTRFYFGNGTLTRRRPAAGTDTEVWTGAGNPCGRPVDQWIMGGISVPAHALGAASAPCADNDNTTGTPPTSLRYTTKPFRRPRRVAGPISATVYARATTPDTQFVAEVEDVAPDGTAYPLTEGALLGSFRKIDRARSWPAGSGMYLLPYHPYTRRSATPVVPGKMTRYDIEIFPTFATIAKGHSLRITLSTSDAPHLMPNLPQQRNLAGGVYTVHRGGMRASALEVPLQRLPAGR